MKMRVLIAVAIAVLVIVIVGASSCLHSSRSRARAYLFLYGVPQSRSLSRNRITRTTRTRSRSESSSRLLSLPPRRLLDTPSISPPPASSPSFRSPLPPLPFARLDYFGLLVVDRSGIPIATAYRPLPHLDHAPRFFPFLPLPSRRSVRAVHALRLRVGLPAPSRIPLSPPPGSGPHAALVPSRFFLSCPLTYPFSQCPY